MSYLRTIAGCAILAVATFGFSGNLLQAQDSAPAPDNTKVNQRDRDAPRTTADQQQENRSDRDVAQQIRKSIMDDKGLSTYAHNVKVIVENGTVTLKGPVHSEEEKSAVEAKAREVAGKRNVKSEIDVK